MTDAPELGPPSATVIATYLGEGISASEADLASARLAELAAQRRRCRTPAEDATWPADLVEALCRRVAHNLALRGLPLGLQASVSEGGVAQSRVGGLDAEVRRLEAPYLKLTIG